MDNQFNINNQNPNQMQQMQPQMMPNQMQQMQPQMMPNQMQQMQPQMMPNQMQQMQPQMMPNQMQQMQPQMMPNGMFMPQNQKKLNVFAFIVGLLYIAIAFIPLFKYEAKSGLSGTISCYDIFKARVQMNHNVNVKMFAVHYQSFVDRTYVTAIGMLFVALIIFGVILIIESFVADSRIHTARMILAIIFAVLFVYCCYAFIQDSTNDFLDCVGYMKEDRGFIYEVKDPGVGLLPLVFTPILAFLTPKTRRY